MRVPTGIHCQKCDEELKQDSTGNMWCKCGKKVRFVQFRSGGIVD